MLEQVLSKFIKPALQASFSTTNSATVSVPCLHQWFAANCWDCSTTCALDGEEQRGPSTTIGQKRHFRELEDASEDCEVHVNDVIGSQTAPELGPGLKGNKVIRCSVIKITKTYCKETFFCTSFIDANYARP